MKEKLKKYWNEVSIRKIKGIETVFLDDKALLSPMGKKIVLPTKLTEAVYEEWSIIDDKIIPSKMPNFSLAVTAIDRVSTQRDYICSQLLSFANNDLICYWSGEDTVLKNKQELEWKPIIEWFEKENKIKLEISLSIMPIKHEIIKKSIIKKDLENLNDLTLSGLFNLVSSSGSFILSWSLYKKQTNLNRFYNLALLEELYQVEKWGTDKEADFRREQIYRNFKDAYNFLNLLSVSF